MRHVTVLNSCLDSYFAAVSNLESVHQLFISFFLLLFIFDPSSSYEQDRKSSKCFTKTYILFQYIDSTRLPAGNGEEPSDLHTEKPVSPFRGWPKEV